MTEVALSVHPTQTSSHHQHQHNHPSILKPSAETSKSGADSSTYCTESSSLESASSPTNSPQQRQEGEVLLEDNNNNNNSRLNSTTSNINNHNRPSFIIQRPQSVHPEVQQEQQQRVPLAIRVVSPQQHKVVVPVISRPVAPLKKNIVHNSAVQQYQQQPSQEQRLRQRQLLQHQELETRKRLQLQQREVAAKEQFRKRAQCNFPATTSSSRNIITKTMGSGGNSNNAPMMNGVVTSNPGMDGSGRGRGHNVYRNSDSLDMHNGNNNNNGHPQYHHSGSGQQAPLFERIVTEEVQELKTCLRVMETLQSRLKDMERVHHDLESRLERSTKEKIDLETHMEDLNRDWSARCDSLETERDGLTKRCNEERGRNERLSDLVNRKDKEIHRMIQRKYDSSSSNSNRNLGGHDHRSHMKKSHSSSRSNNADSNRSLIKSSDQQVQADTKVYFPMKQSKSPHEILEERGSVEAVRVRNVIHSLLDFFGM